MTLEEVHFDVEVALLPTSDTTRKHPIGTGYRPNHKHPLTGEYFMGQFTFPAEGGLAPGFSSRARVAVLAPPAIIPELRHFGSWTIWEGPRHIGSVRVLAGEN